MQSYQRHNTWDDSSERGLQVAIICWHSPHHPSPLENSTNKKNYNVNRLMQSIGMAVGWMEQCQSYSHTKASMFQRVKTQIQTEEISLLDKKLEGVLVCLQHEEDRLWNELRARAMIMAAAPEQPRQHAAVAATKPSSGSSGGLVCHNKPLSCLRRNGAFGSRRLLVCLSGTSATFLTAVTYT
jgi:hypothetical protein